MGNGHGKFTIEFLEGDAPMLAHAFIIARTTARQCGHPAAEDRFSRYLELISAFVPAVSKMFDEEDWGDMIAALRPGQPYEVRFEAKSAWNRNDPEDEGEITVTIGKTVFTSRFFDVRRRHEAEVIIELERLAPLGCRRAERAK